MKKKLASFKVDVSGYVPDADDDQLATEIEEIITGVIKFTLEMNGISSADVRIEAGSIVIGEAEEGELEDPVKKIVDMISDQQAQVVDTGGSTIEEVLENLQKKPFGSTDDGGEGPPPGSTIH